MYISNKHVKIILEHQKSEIILVQFVHYCDNFSLFFRVLLLIFFALFMASDLFWLFSLHDSCRSFLLLDAIVIRFLCFLLSPLEAKKGCNNSCKRNKHKKSNIKNKQCTNVKNLYKNEAKGLI